MGAILMCGGKYLHKTHSMRLFFLFRLNQNLKGPFSLFSSMSQPCPLLLFSRLFF